MMGVLRGLLSTVLMMAMCWMIMESVEELCMQHNPDDGEQGRGEGALRKPSCSGLLPLQLALTDTCKLVVMCHHNPDPKLFFAAIPTNSDDKRVL
jgi:hypothetical protein